MQSIESLKFNQAMTTSLQNSYLNDANLDMVTLHCKRDHFSPNLPETKSSSCYKASYSPTKTPVNYNETEVSKGLYKFRRYQNSTSQLPSLGKVSEHSLYQKSFSPHNKEKDPKASAQGSNFMKMTWALDPTSNYKSDFKNNKEASQWNKDNAERHQYNKLAVFKLLQNPKRESHYKNDFKPISIKQEAEMIVKHKDHIASHSKENWTGESSISEYQRKYDSVMERTKGTNSGLSLYGKGKVVKRSS